MRLINIAQAGPISDAKPLSEILINFISFLVTLIGAIAVLIVIVSGIIYMTSGGDPGRVRAAKRGLIGAIIGLCIAALSLIIVKVVVAFV